MLRVGLLGAGRIGLVHAKAISAHPQSKLVAIADVVKESATKLAGQYAPKRAATKPSSATPRSTPCSSRPRPTPTPT